jgi:hypothetical protein
MKTLTFAIVLLLPVYAMGQPTPTERELGTMRAEGNGPNEIPEVPKGEAAEPEILSKVEPKPVDAVEIVTSVGKVINDWKNVGWLAGVIALINFLLSLLRFKPIDMALDRLDWKWLKPLIATLLGAALGGFSTFSTGAGVLNSVVAGMLAGLGSVGFHELVDNMRKQTRKAEG